MISLQYTQKTSADIPQFLPIFSEDMDAKKRKIFRGLTRAQKRAVRSVLQRSPLAKSGVIPIFSGDAPVFLYILGKKAEIQRREVHEAGQGVFSAAGLHQQEKIQVVPGSLDRELFSAFREGVLLGSFEFLGYKGQKKGVAKEQETKLKSVIIFGSEQKKESAYIKAVYEGVSMAKEIINTPPSDANPEFVSDIAQQIAKQHKTVKLTELRQKELEKLGCGGIVGVGKGSKYEPRLILLEYKGGSATEKPLALVGKGVCYDTGGHSLKVSPHMRWMKSDLGGAATVLGAFSTLVQLGVKKNLIAVVPAVQNILSRDAYFPDDVLRMYNGMTVEVDNTDAEGRLILADALSYVNEKYQPKAIIDLATLTGACMVAVGSDYAAVMGNNPKLTGDLIKSSLAVDEPIWELPLHKRYAKALESKIADIVNCSQGLRAGTIEGGLFLQNFVQKETPWCHLDIASVTLDSKSNLATGRNVRLLTHFASHF